MFTKKDLDRFRVKPGSVVDLAKFPTAWTGGKAAKKLDKDQIKRRAKSVLEDNREDLAEIQELIYASDTYSVLIILQAMDAAGKDSTIRHVMSGVNPQGCQVFSFKHPSAEELDHNFLWRYAKNLPERGRIGIFNRSYYEEVLVLKVHPHRVSKQLPDPRRSKAFWKARYDDIAAFERHLTRNGTLILKFFLHLSKEEQRQRFLDRLTKPDKHWKFSSSDLKERGYWDAYQRVYEDALSATSTDYAPWYVVPADNKSVTRAIVSSVIVNSVRGLDLKWPTVSDEELQALAEAKKHLEAGAPRGKKSKGSRKKPRT